MYSTTCGGTCVQASTFLTLHTIKIHDKLGGHNPRITEINIANTILPGEKLKRKRLAVPTDQCDSFTSHRSGWYEFHKFDNLQELNNDFIQTILKFLEPSKQLRYSNNGLITTKVMTSTTIWDLQHMNLLPEELAYK